MQACSQKQGTRPLEEYAESVRLLSSQVGAENRSELAQAWGAGLNNQFISAAVRTSMLSWDEVKTPKTVAFVRQALGNQASDYASPPRGYLQFIRLYQAGQLESPIPENPQPVQLYSIMPSTRAPQQSEDDSWDTVTPGENRRAKTGQARPQISHKPGPNNLPTGLNTSVSVLTESIADQDRHVRSINPSAQPGPG
ncbi:hypothetical protein PENFLA_c009G10827 [Penicillium flavigenum]|uniref:Uncharacterized protein n=1 Tax=Penicillium flavigenum TaxID=254877 RepID=A0A1V6TGM0_9EURO|nr:hypothetical protein PENFLA_c009G10827 [Penicillium flavigenum]